MQRVSDHQDAPHSASSSGGGNIGELPSLSDMLPLNQLEPVVFDATASKRERQRAAGRDKRSRRLARGRELLAQVASLERQLKQLMLLATDANGDDRYSTNLELALTPGATVERHELERLLRYAAQTKVMLREENAALRRHVMAARQQRLGLLHALNMENPLCVSYASSFVILKPLTPEQCRAIHAEGEEMVKFFLATTIKNSWVRTIRGWREGRAIHNDIYNFIYQKAFNDHSAADLCDRTFAVLSEPSGLSQFYSPDQNVSIRVLQKVDENNVAFFEEMILEETDTRLVVSKAIVLVARVVTGTGHRIFIRCLNTDELPIEFRSGSMSDPVCPRPGQSVKEMWSSRVHWMQFDTLGGGCVASYAGVVPTEGSSAWYWMHEMVLDTLRWEFFIKPPPFRLPS